MDGIKDIAFPNLGLYLSDVPDGITIGNIEIKFYGIIIAVAFLLAYFIVAKEAKRLGADAEKYLDCFLIMLIPVIIGARLYYVIFDWDNYKDNLKEIINIRNGGLAIYGGVIVGIIGFYICCKVKKIKFGELADVFALPLVLGQCLGRWGNFFNREAFGGNDKGLFAMRIPTEAVNVTYSDSVATHNVDIGFSYIQVQPTFLYESTLCLAIFIILMLVRKHKKADGEVMLLYLFLYGIGRFIIEGYRSDQLVLCSIGDFQIPVSQVVAVLMVIASVVLFFVGRARLNVSSYLDEDEEAAVAEVEATEAEDKEEVVESISESDSESSEEE